MKINENKIRELLREEWKAEQFMEYIHSDDDFQSGYVCVRRTYGDLVIVGTDLWEIRGKGKDALCYDCEEIYCNFKVVDDEGEEITGNDWHAYLPQDFLQIDYEDAFCFSDLEDRWHIMDKVIDQVSGCVAFDICKREHTYLQEYLQDREGIIERMYNALYAGKMPDIVLERSLDCIEAPSLTVNSDGMEKIAGFIKENLKNGDTLCTDQDCLNAWATQAEESILSGTPQIEIRSSDSISKVPEVLHLDLEKDFDLNR